MTNKEADAANAAKHTDAVANAENAVVKDTEDAANAAKHTEGAENAVVVVGVGDKRAGEEDEEDEADAKDAKHLTYLVLLEVASYLCF
jgi:hypothetical protein